MHFVVLQDPIDTGLLDIEDLAADRQDRLDPRIPTTLGRAAGRVTLDDEDLALVGVRRLTVREFSGQPAAAQQPFSITGSVPRLPGGDPRDGRRLTLANDQLPLAGVLLEPIAELGS